MASLFKTQ